MAEMYMRNIRDWREATMMLSFEEKGYFDELISLIYLYDDLLPDDDDFICRAMPVHKRQHLRLKKRLLDLGLIEIKNGHYFNYRSTKELNKINLISTKNQVKAAKRWSKSLKNNETGDAAADAGAMLKVKVNSEYILKEKKQAKKESFENGKEQTGKCTIDTVLDPDGPVPDEYRQFAEEHDLDDIQRRFNDWASWWVSEAGHKAGAGGWLQTWKTRVRRIVVQTEPSSSDQAGRTRDSRCATTEGARLALDRRRNKRREIR